MFLQLLTKQQGKFYLPLLACFFFASFFFHHLNEEVCIAICFIGLMYIFAKIANTAVIGWLLAAGVNLFNEMTFSFMSFLIALEGFFFSFMCFTHKFCSFLAVFVDGLQFILELMLHIKGNLLFVNKGIYNLSEFSCDYLNLDKIRFAQIVVSHFYLLEK